MLTSRRVYLRRASVTVIVCNRFNAAAPGDGDVTVVETQINPDHWHDGDEGEDDEKFTTSRVEPPQRPNLTPTTERYKKKGAYKYMTLARSSMKQNVVDKS